MHEQCLVIKLKICIYEEYIREVYPNVSHIHHIETDDASTYNLLSTMVELNTTQWDLIISCCSLCSGMESTAMQIPKKIEKYFSCEFHTIKFHIFRCICKF